MPGPDETTEPDDAGTTHEVPDDLLELFEAIEADRAGLIPRLAE